VNRPPAKPPVEYEASRLLFKRDVIEALRDDDPFRIVTPDGTFVMTKREFYRVFANVPATKSYRERGAYHYPTVPQAAEQFRVGSDARISSRKPTRAPRVSRVATKERTAIGGESTDRSRVTDRSSHPDTIVDTSNVALADRPIKKASLENIRLMMKHLETIGRKAMFVADASLRYQIDDRLAFERMLDDGTITQVPARTVADEWILRLARKFDADVVSNDQFKPYHEDFPNEVARRRTFMIVRGNVFLDGVRSAKSGQPRQI
jgi:hypothetical protein